MKNIRIVFLSIAFIFLFHSLGFALDNRNSNWRISIRPLNLSGTFDYILYYSGFDSQIISKVSLPQNQNMMIVEGEFHFRNHHFITVQYGDSGLGMKGRGSDSDWTTFGSAKLTDYGELDLYGRQQIFGVDLGTVLLEDERQKISVFLGWGQETTTNELKNVVYHLKQGVDIGNQSQPDNGSYLNGQFGGVRVGVADELLIQPNLAFKLGFTFLGYNAEANGHWANHEPAWDWVDTGSGTGYHLNAGLQYTLNHHLVAEIGYDYAYHKADGCVEVLNNQVLDQPVDLKYEQKGIWLRLGYWF